MLYNLLRILLGAGILTALLFFLKKRRKWQIRTLAIFSALILYCAICLWPFENLFFSFPTPEAAYSYRYKDSIQMIIPGEESCMIVSDKGESSFLVKVPNGWALENGFFHLTQFVLDQKFSFFVFHHNQIKDDYIILSHLEGNPLDLHDNRGSSFLFRSKEIPSMGKDYFTYCAAVRDIDSSYTLTIDGEVWPIGEKIASAS